MGRPPKTEVEHALVKAICEHIVIGAAVKHAAEAEGVPESTLYRWIEKFPKFARAIARARARAAVELQKLAISESKGARGAQWTLERRYRQEYAPPPKEAETSDSITIKIEGGLPRSPQ